MEQIIVSLKFMNFIFPSFLILIVSSALCFSNTISVGNATYTIPEDWTTDVANSNFARVSDSSNSMYFIIGTGYPFGAMPPQHPDIYITSHNGIENNSIESSDSILAISNKVDTDMYRAVLNNNFLQVYFYPDWVTIHLTPVSIELLDTGAYERIYNYTAVVDGRAIQP